MVKTIVIGLDGATWSLIEPLLEEEKLPNLKQLIDGGTSGVMESTTPPMTPLAWTSMSTGTNPGKHGIYDFLEQDTESYQIRPTTYSKMSRPAIWDLFNEKKKDVGVINYPLVHPPDKVDPFFISGIPASDEDSIAYPDFIQDTLESTDYRVHPHASSDNPKEYFEELIDLTESQVDLTIKLAEEYDPELLWTVFMSTDWAQHYLWDKKIDNTNAVEKLYQKFDSYIGEIVGELADGCNVVVVSDHGARKIDGEIHLNSLLEKWGYIQRKETSKENNLSRIKKILLASMWKIGSNLPPSLKNLVKQKTPSNTLNDIRAAADIAQLNMHNSIDWANTTAFSYGYMGRVFLHTDNYPEGKISKESDFEKLRDELILKLEDLEHPKTNEKIIENVYQSESIYWGDNAALAPDLVIEPKGWRYMIYGDFGDGTWINSPQGRVADHDNEGIVILSGENIQDTDTKFECDITDIAPTLLHLHNLPILHDMDGTVLTNILTKKYMAQNEITVEENQMDIGENGDRSRENRDKIEDQLEDLGYL